MSSAPQTSSTGSRGLYLLAAFVVIVAGMKAAATIVVPILAAMFVAIVSLPPTAALVRLGVRRWLATLTVFFVVMLLGLGTAAVVASTATAFASELPVYQELLQGKIDEAVDWIREQGVEIDPEQVDGVLAPNMLFPLLGQTLTSFVGLLQDTIFVLLTVSFILMELTAIPSKVRAMAPADTSDETLERWTKVLGDLSGYLVVKTVTSAITGILAGLGCWLFGLPYAVVFGLIAFLLNYVPSLGSIIASIPAILVAVVLEGFGTAIGVAVLYLFINISIGSLTEPRIMGRRMGLSPLVVFLSLVFWGFILGPVGMFLSVPLTMIVKILLEGAEDLKWVAVILGPGEPSTPPRRDHPRVGSHPSSPGTDS